MYNKLDIIHLSAWLQAITTGELGNRGLPV
jgi:hypothetical protein